MYRLLRARGVCVCVCVCVYVCIPCSCVLTSGAHLLVTLCKLRGRDACDPPPAPRPVWDFHARPLDSSDAGEAATVIVIIAHFVHLPVRARARTAEFTDVRDPGLHEIQTNTSSSFWSGVVTRLDDSAHALFGEREHVVGTAHLLDPIVAGKPRSARGTARSDGVRVAPDPKILAPVPTDFVRTYHSDLQAGGDVRCVLVGDTCRQQTTNA